MSSNESRSRGILRLKHLREVHEAKVEEMAELAPRFARLADPESAPRAVSAFNLFQTPEPLAAQLAGMFTAFGRTLEPSAGLGRLYRASRAMGAHHVTLVENNPDCCRELYQATEHDPHSRLIQADFLECHADRLGTFDSVIMNPPFKNGIDIAHIQHALRLLNPGGKLVSLCAAGPRQRTAFQSVADEWIELPPGSFKSEGTSVAVAVVVFTRE